MKQWICAYIGGMSVLTFLLATGVVEFVDVQAQVNADPSPQEAAIVKAFSQQPRTSMRALRAVVAETIQPEVDRLAGLAGEQPMNVGKVLRNALIPPPKKPAISSPYELESIANRMQVTYTTGEMSAAYTALGELLAGE